MYFMLESISQHTRPSVCLPFKTLNHGFQFSKLSMKTDLEDELNGCRGEGWIEWMLMHKLLYLKQVTNKGLLYSIWKSAQCYVAAWMEGKFGGEWIRIYGWLHPFTVYMKLSQHC